MRGQSYERAHLRQECVWELSGLSEETFVTGLSRLAGMEPAEVLEFGVMGAKVLVAEAVLGA